MKKIDIKGENEKGLNVIEITGLSAGRDIKIKQYITQYVNDRFTEFCIEKEKVIYGKSGNKDGGKKVENIIGILVTEIAKQANVLWLSGECKGTEDDIARELVHSILIDTPSAVKELRNAMSEYEFRLAELEKRFEEYKKQIQKQIAEMQQQTKQDKEQQRKEIEEISERLRKLEEAQKGPKEVLAEQIEDESNAVCSALELMISESRREQQGTSTTGENEPIIENTPYFEQVEEVSVEEFPPADVIDNPEPVIHKSDKKSGEKDIFGNLYNKANSGDAEAQFKLAEYYVKTNRNNKEAISWYNKAIKNNHNGAKYQLGHILLFYGVSDSAKSKGLNYLSELAYLDSAEESVRIRAKYSLAHYYAGFMPKEYRDFENFDEDKSVNHDSIDIKKSCDLFAELSLPVVENKQFMVKTEDDKILLHSCYMLGLLKNYWANKKKKSAKGTKNSKLQKATARKNIKDSKIIIKRAAKLKDASARRFLQYEISLLAALSCFCILFGLAPFFILMLNRSSDGYIWGTMPNILLFSSLAFCILFIIIYLLYLVIINIKYKGRRNIIFGLFGILLCIFLIILYPGILMRNDFRSSYYDYEINEDNTLTISMAYNFRDKKELSIPTEIDGHIVTAIGSSAFSGCSSLTSIEIPSSVTSIDSHAFYNCSSLISIKIPSSVTSIGPWAFSGCSNLTSATFGDNSQLTSIGLQAFYNCSSLTSIKIPISVTRIDEFAFSDCSSITIYCEATKKPVGWSSSWDWEYIPVVWGHNNITTEIEYDYVVHNDKVYLTKYKGDAKEVVIPQTIDNKEVVSIGSTFNNNTDITSIKIPSGVTSIVSNAFYSCSSLASIEVDANNAKYKSEGNCIIEKSTNKLILGCKNSIIPKYVTSIGSYAFYGCSRLTSIKIPSSVTSIDYMAFEGCSRLTSIDIPSRVTSIGSYAFWGCSSLKSIDIPSSVTYIGSYAFSGCSSLTIYCEVESQPSGWESSWNKSNCPVVWGYKGQ